MTVLLHGLRMHIDLEKTEKKENDNGLQILSEGAFFIFRHLHEIFPKL